MSRKKLIGLTPQQIVFMRALQTALSDAGTPVSAEQIRIVLRKSDSRVRSHLKVLIVSGYVRCVGRTKRKRYVPSALWMEEVDVVEPSIKHMGYNGGCQIPGCNELAVEFFAGKYMCRDHVIGRDLISDLKELRERWRSTLGPSSSAGALIDEGLPIREFNDEIQDLYFIETQEEKPKKTKSTRRHRVSGRSGHGSAIRTDVPFAASSF